MRNESLKCNAKLLAELNSPPSLVEKHLVSITLTLRNVKALMKSKPPGPVAQRGGICAHVSQGGILTREGAELAIKSGTQPPSFSLCLGLAYLLGLLGGRKEGRNYATLEHPGGRVS